MNRCNLLMLALPPLKVKAARLAATQAWNLYTRNSDAHLCEGSRKCYTANFIEQNQLMKSSSKKQSIKYGPRLEITKWGRLNIFMNIKHFHSNNLRSYINSSCSVIHTNQLVSFPTGSEGRNSYCFIQLQSFTQHKEQIQQLQWKPDYIFINIWQLGQLTAKPVGWKKVHWSHSSCNLSTVLLKMLKKLQWNCIH